MSLDVRHMSRQEFAFLRIYALALKRQFSMFVSALSMMRTDELDLKCPVESARIAAEMNTRHAEFEQTLAEVTRGNKFRVKQDDVERPTADEITQVIQISFFKLIKPGQMQNLSEDLGWFSGHPLEWEKAWKQAAGPEQTGPGAIASALINALSNLFGLGAATEYKKPADEPYEEPDEDDDWYEEDDYDN